jgi:hypothetical protein
VGGGERAAALSENRSMEHNVALLEDGREGEQRQEDSRDVAALVSDRAGIRNGDVVCTFNGESVMNKAGSFISEALADTNEPTVSALDASIAAAWWTVIPLHGASEQQS